MWLLPHGHLLQPVRFVPLRALGALAIAHRSLDGPTERAATLALAAATTALGGGGGRVFAPRLAPPGAVPAPDDGGGGDGAPRARARAHVCVRTCA